MNSLTLFLLAIGWMIGQDSLLTHNRVLTSKTGLSKPVRNQGELISVPHLLQHTEDYHQKIIRLRGRVTRLELHLDKTNHFIDYVFFLKQEKQQVLVFGRHDRTKGDIQLTSDRMVEVQGLFWKERVANGHVLENNLEALDVWFYPPLRPDQASRCIPVRTA